MLVFLKRMLFGILVLGLFALVVSVTLFIGYTFPYIILGILAILLVYVCGAMVDEELKFRKKDKLIPHG